MRRGDNPHPAISVQIRIPPQCCEFGHGSQLVITDLLSVKKSVTHVSEGAHRDISEIPALQAGKHGYGFSGRTLPHRSKTGSHLCACSLMAEHQTSNLMVGVRFSSRTPHGYCGGLRESFEVPKALVKRYIRPSAQSVGSASTTDCEFN